MRSIFIIFIALFMTALIVCQAYSEILYKFNYKHERVEINKLSKAGANLLIPYFYDHESRRIYFFNVDGSIKHTMSVAENMSPAVSNSGDIVVLVDPSQNIRCGAIGRIEVKRNDGKNLFEGNTAFAFAGPKYISASNIYFCCGRSDSPMRFLDATFKPLKRYRFRVIEYLFVDSENIIICALSGIGEDDIRFSILGNDIYIGCFDYKGNLLCKSKVSNNAMRIEALDYKKDSNMIELIFTNGNKLIEIHTLNMNCDMINKIEFNTKDAFHVSPSLNGIIAMYGKNSVYLYRLDDKELINTFSTEELKQSYSREDMLFHRRNGIKLLDSNYLILKYSQRNTNNSAVSIYDLSGNLVYHKLALPHQYNRWNMTVTDFKGLLIYYADSTSVVVEQIQQVKQ